MAIFMASGNSVSQRSAQVCASAFLCPLLNSTEPPPPSVPSLLLPSSAAAAYQQEAAPLLEIKQKDDRQLTRRAIERQLSK